MMSLPHLKLPDDGGVRHPRNTAPCGVAASCCINQWEIVMKLSQSKAIVEASIDNQINQSSGRDACRVVPYLVGGAGLGKTSIIQEIAEQRDIDCKIVSLAQYDAGELAGWLVNDGDGMKRLRPDWMPKDGEGILFLDELPQSPVSNQNIAAQIVNERRVGEHRLPDGWAIVAAGNRTSDRAGTNSMPTHLRDRLMFLEVEADLDDTVKYYNAKGVAQQVCAFIRFRPEFLHKFERDANACPSPRSWDRVSSILSWGLDATCQTEAIAGQVGRPAAADFIGFLRVYEAVPDMDQLIANPDSAVLPDDPAVLYAVSSALAYKMSKANASNVIRYLKRLPQQEFAAFVIKDALARDRDLKNVEAVRQWILSDGKHLIL
jgi:hypothetical protein